MLSVVIAAGLLAAAPEPSRPDPDDQAAYHRAATTAGRNAAAQVRLALWCEAHGLPAERLKHLALAVLADPSHATARGLLGLVDDAGRWRRPEAVAERIRSDAELAASLAEYNARRERTPNTAEAQWRLALWCEQKGLKAEATAHLAMVIRLDPKREAAWRKLGYKKQKTGRWATEEQLAAEKAETEAQRKADKHWKPLLEKWKGQLSDKARRAEAQSALAEVTDPRAVPSILRVFASGGVVNQARAIQILGQIASPSASRALAVLAVLGDSAEVRRAATETLKQRDPSEFADVLIAGLRAQYRYEVLPVGGPGSPGVLFVEGRRFNVQRFYAPPAFHFPIFPGERIGFDPFGLPVVWRTVGAEIQTAPPIPAAAFTGRQYLGESPVPAADRTTLQQTLRDPQNNPATITDRDLWKPGARQQGMNAFVAMLGSDYDVDVTRTDTVTRLIEAQIPVGQMMVEAQKSAIVAQQQLRNDVADVERTNRIIRQRNSRIAQVLRDVTGQDLGDDTEAWRAWWVDRLGFTYTPPPPPAPRPTVVQDVPLAYVPQPVPVLTATGPVAGTSSELKAHATLTHDGEVRMARLGIPRCCFGAGTLVCTRAGSRPIEAVRVGDQVLTQDLASGALSFQPVLMAYHFPPDSTLRINLGDETIVSSPLHRFWAAGRGWLMARDLEPDDTLRTLDGPVRVDSVEDRSAQPVFNLEVARGHSFSVGRRGALVHDNSLVRPTPEPFDSVAAPVALTDRDR